MSNNPGKSGEEAAQAFLERRGYRIVDVNVRLGARRDGLPGEIDIVAWDGPTLCFVEVKTRRSVSVAASIEAVTPSKQRQIARLALAYAARHELLDDSAEISLRFDVVAVQIAPNRDGSNANDSIAIRRIELVQGAFLAPEGFTE